MKMDEFKEFVKNKPYLKDRVNEGKTTWQELYEHYDLYGEDDVIFNEDKEEEEKAKDNKKKDGGVNQFFDMLGDIDVNKITEGLNGMKKILNILAEVTATEENSNLNRRKTHQPYSRDDD